MSLVTRDPGTSLRRGPVVYPDGQPPSPYGCRWCGVERGGHGRQWKASAGMHAWAEPTRAQILARMRARRAARLNAPPAKFHATTGWAPELDGESAEPYCADCGTTACAQWNRITTRFMLRRQGLRRWPKPKDPTAGWGSTSPF